jgi:hypothetical protein
MEKISRPSPERKIEMEQTLKCIMTLWRNHHDKPLASLLYDVVLSKNPIRYSDGALVNHLTRLLKMNERTFDVPESEKI